MGVNILGNLRHARAVVIRVGQEKTTRARSQVRQFGLHIHSPDLILPIRKHGLVPLHRSPGTHLLPPAGFHRGFESFLGLS